MKPDVPHRFSARRAGFRRFGRAARNLSGAHALRPRRKTMVVATKEEHPVPFVVGRISKADRRLMVLEPETPSPIPGPWDLRAVFGL